MCCRRAELNPVLEVHGTKLSPIRRHPGVHAGFPLVIGRGPGSFSALRSLVVWIPAYDQRDAGMTSSKLLLVPLGSKK
jgi:hypothetical protein